MIRTSLRWAVAAICGAFAVAADAAESVFRTLNGEPLPLADFRRFVGFEHRADPRFDGERTALFQEYVIRAEADRLAIEVRRENAEARYSALDREARRHDGKGLDEVLAAQDVSREEFLRRLEIALLLEEIVRDAFDLGSATVPEEKQNVWLQDRMSRTKVQRDQLPPDLLARVEERPITLDEFGGRILDSLSRGSPIRQALEQRFLEAHAVRQYAASHGIELRESDLDRAIAERAAQLRAKPGMADVDLDDVLAENGSSVADLRLSLRFRTRILLERLADEVEFKGTDLWLFYRSHQSAFDELYGEQPILSTIFFRAGEATAKRAGFLDRSYEEAERDLANLEQDIAAGTFKFDAVARSRSDHPSKDKGGFLGPVGVKTPGVGDLARRVLIARDRGELKIGDLFGPVRMVDGVHLVMVNGFLARKRFEEIAPEVRKYAMNELLRAIMERAVMTG